jgi:hypothetical protein
VIVRQRLRERRSPLTWVGRLLLVPVALGLVWYGAMLGALSVKVSPGAVDAISGYRSAFEFLAGLEPDDVTGQVRLIVGLSGLAAFLALGFLAWKEIPRPYLARTDLLLASGPRGVVIVEPRAIERAAEGAVGAHPAVSDASARYVDDQVTVDLNLRTAGDVSGVLREVQGRVVAALAGHGLPTVPINVNLTGFDNQRRRELA